MQRRHGDTSTDSHHELPIVEHPPDRLRRVEWKPFEAAIAAGVVSIMTAHVLATSLDEQRPATLSSRVVEGALRRELGFEGVIVSDDLEMKAIAHDYAVPDAAVMAVEAGCDAVLICSGDVQTQVAALEAVIYAVERERLAYARVEDAVKRNRRAKERFLPASVSRRPSGRKPLRSVLGCDAHRAVADQMARFL